MSTHDVDGLNAGYARALLDEYLDNPEAVPSEWRALFESGGSELVATHPGIARLLETLPQNASGDNGHVAVGQAPQTQPASELDAQLLGGVAAAMALVPTARRVFLPRGSTRSAPSRSAIRPSSRFGSCRS